MQKKKVLLLLLLLFIFEFLIIKIKSKNIIKKIKNIFFKKNSKITDYKFGGENEFGEEILMYELIDQRVNTLDLKIIDKNNMQKVIEKKLKKLDIKNKLTYNTIPILYTANKHPDNIQLSCDHDWYDKIKAIRMEKHGNKNYLVYTKNNDDEEAYLKIDLSNIQHMKKTLLNLPKNLILYCIERRNILVLTDQTTIPIFPLSNVEEFKGNIKEIKILGYGDEIYVQMEVKPLQVYKGKDTITKIIHGNKYNRINVIGQNNNNTNILNESTNDIIESNNNNILQEFYKKNKKNIFLLFSLNYKNSNKQMFRHKIALLYEAVAENIECEFVNTYVHKLYSFSVSCSNFHLISPKTIKNSLINSAIILGGFHATAIGALFLNNLVNKKKLMNVINEKIAHLKMPYRGDEFMHSLQTQNLRESLEFLVESFPGKNTVQSTSKIASKYYIPKLQDLINHLKKEFSLYHILYLVLPFIVTCVLFKVPFYLYELYFFNRYFKHILPYYQHALHKNHIQYSILFINE